MTGLSVAAVNVRGSHLRIAYEFSNDTSVAPLERLPGTQRERSD
jgi:hypothetical protein